MSLIDFILNIACLLLWVNWRSAHLEPLAHSLPSTLLGTLKPAEPSRLRTWASLVGVALLLVLRALVYWAIGSPADWTPKLHLGVVVLAFPGEQWWTDLFFSVLSFTRVLLVFYFWLLVVLCVARPAEEPGSVRHLLRLQLGAFGRWPWPLQLLTPPVSAGALWLALYWPLVKLNVLNRPSSLLHLAEQALLIGASMVLSLKILLPPFLILSLVASHVYLGGGPFWELVSSVARGLLAPLRKLPLRIGRVDLAPVAGILLLFLLLDWFPNYLLGVMERRHLSLWPQ